jgi:hypothetical protein
MAYDGSSIDRVYEYKQRLSSGRIENQGIQTDYNYLVRVASHKLRKASKLPLVNGG